MADAQIAIIDGDQTQVVLAPGENPAIVTSIPGPQGPAGAGVPTGGAANEVLYKVSSTFGDTAWGPITSAMIGDLQIVNADVSASAAIAGTKISPNFGSQNVVTTGTNTAASFIPTSSTAPTNGLYLSAANSVALSTNGQGRLFIDSSGNVGINTTSATAYGMNLAVVGTVGLIPSTFGAVGTSVSVRSQLGAAGGEEIVRNEITSFANASNYGTATIFTTRNGASVGERLRITSAGLVGIGTSSPSNTAGFSQQLQLSGNLPCISIDNTGTGANKYSFGVNGVGALGIWDNTASAFRMYINSSGSVGIGTSSVSSTLHIVDSSSAANGTIRLGGGTGLSGYYSIIQQDAVINGKLIYNSVAATGAVHGHQFQVDGTAAVTIDALRRVGIGNNAPNRRLEISDLNADNFIRVNTSGAFKSGIELSNLGTAFGQLYFNNVAPYDLSLLQQYTTGSLILGTNNTERARIDSSGRLGIGTTSPQSLASVGLGSSVDNGLSLTFTGDNSVKAKFYANTSSGAVSIGGSASGYFPVFLSNNSEAARIDTSGRLLVGTSSSTSAAFLQIEGNTVEGATGAGSIKLRRGTATPSDGANLGALVFSDNTSGDGVYVLGQRDGGTWSASSKPSRLVFSVSQDGSASPTERLRISNDGFTNLFVTNNDGFQSRNSAAAGTANACFVGRHSASNTTTGTTAFIVWSNGNVVNTNGSYGTISDAKLKENIVDANSQWDDIKALKVRNYNFKEGQTHTQIGLVAQEAELVSPGLVSESPDRDAEGNDLGTTTKSVNLTVLYMKAVKALQEAMERIEVLEARLDAANL